ncbi:MAG: glycosyltransferase family 9 protein [Bacteroidetes bacterium]|nr:glycosyltransferase family 9 protein [Bacteroidota bacterium]
MHYCIFRTDRIGDLVLTLPMAEAIKRSDPAARVTFCVQEYTRPLLSLDPNIDNIIAIGGRDLDGSVRRFASLLREKQIDVAVFAYPRPRLALAAALARIPIRIGTGYRWYSPLFTRRRAEHRRSGDKHEMEYNLRLLEETGIAVPADLHPALHIDADHRAIAKDMLGRAGIDAGTPFVVLHPGSGGSARDWPAERFAEFAQGLLAVHPTLQLLVTGTATELPLMETVAGGDERIHLLREQLPLDILAAVLAEARLFVSNSTGPLHIAAACGVPVLGFYPFGTAVNARRWGPRAERSAVLSPTPDPACTPCQRGDCPEHDDMRRIPVAEALAAVRGLLARSS